MSFQLQLQCHKQPDVVERILRVVRHRGFTLDAMNMTPSACGQRIELLMTVSSLRPAHLLITQVQKLHDVVTLVCTDSQADNTAPSQVIALE